jgi:hypothetical protein
MLGVRAQSSASTVGASVGGLEAFSALLEKLTADAGMAFVFFHTTSAHSSGRLSGHRSLQEEGIDRGYAAGRQSEPMSTANRHAVLGARGP